MFAYDLMIHYVFQFQKMEDREPFECHIHSVSPLKKSSAQNKKFFNCWLQSNEEDVIRVVCFDPHRHDELSSLKTAKTAVKIQSYKKNQQGEITLDDKCKFIPVPKLGFQYREPVATNEVLSIAQLANVASEQLVKIKAEVTAVSGVKVLQTLHQGALKKQDVTVRDPTSSIKLVLWGNLVDSLEADTTYLLKNLKLKSNKYGRYLNTPKDAEFQYEVVEPFDQQLAEVDDPLVENQSVNGRIIAVSQANRKICCISCTRKVIPSKDSPGFGECEECGTLQNTEFCDIQWNVKLVIQSSSDPMIKRRVLLYNQQLMKLASVSNLQLDLNSVSEKELNLALLQAQLLTFEYESDTQKVTDISLV